MSDGFASIDDSDRLAARHDACDDLVEDGLWVLCPGVVAGRDGDVAAFRRRLGHLWALVAVPVSSAAEDGDDLAAGQWPDSIQQLLQSIGRVGVVDEDAYVFAIRNGFEPAWNWTELGKHTGLGLAGALAGQLAWSVALYLAGSALLAVATRKVVVQGG